MFTISDFENVNNDSLVTRILSRLQIEGTIIRVATGIYMNPKKTFDELIARLSDLTEIIRKINITADEL